MRILIIICGLAALLHAQAQNEVVSAGYDIPVYQAVAAGQVTTLFVRGLKVPDASATVMPLPTMLAGITVKVNSGIKNYPDKLPILSVRSYDYCAGRLSVPCPLTHLTVQIPTEPTCIVTGQFPNECTIGPAPVIVLTVMQDGAAGQDFPVVLVSQKPRIITGCDTIFGTVGGICASFVTRADGSLIGFGCVNAAKPGETIVIYAVGLGPTNPLVKTGDPAPSLAPAKAILEPSLILSFRVNLPPASPAPPVVWSPVGAWFKPEFVGLVPGYVGLYQINVKVPAPPSPNLISDGYATMRIAIGAGSFGPADGSTFADVCVQAQ